MLNKIVQESSLHLHSCVTSKGPLDPEAQARESLLLTYACARYDPVAMRALFSPLSFHLPSTTLDYVRFGRKHPRWPGGLTVVKVQVTVAYKRAHGSAVSSA